MRRNVGRYWLMVLSAVALVTVALPAFADPAPTTPPAPTSPCDQYAGLTAKIAGCIRDSIDQGATSFFTGDFYSFFQRAIGAVMTLAVIVYGAMLAFGAVEKVGRDTYVLMMKLAAVVVFCSNGPFIVSTITGAMDSAAAAVVSYTPPSNPDSDATYNCVQTLIDQQSDTDPKLRILAPWLGIDCLVDTVIGIHIKPTTTPTHETTWWNKQIEANNNEGLSRSLLYLFFGAMQTSILGVVLAIIGFFFIYGLIMLIIRCFFAYIAGYMGVTFLSIIAPIIVPMILFKETKQYFDKWARMLVSFALQPVIMLVFLIFSLTALDLAVYSGSYSVYYAIAGKKSQEENFNLNKYLSDPRSVDGAAGCTPPTDPSGTNTDCVGIINKTSKTKLQVKADNPDAIPRDLRDDRGVMNKLLYSKCNKKDIDADPTLKAKCNFTYPLALMQTTIDWARLEGAHDPAITPATNPDGTAVKPGQTIMRMVLSSLFFCLMVVFILNGILQVVPMIVGDLLGDLNQSPIIGGLGGAGKAGGGGGSGLMNVLKNPFKGMGSIGQK